MERAFYKKHKEINAEYKSDIRERIANLKVKDNPELKVNVLLG